MQVPPRLLSQVWPTAQLASAHSAMLLARVSRQSGNKLECKQDRSKTVGTAGRSLCHVVAPMLVIARRELEINDTSQNV